MKTVTCTPQQLEYRDNRCGLYHTPKGYVLVEYATGDARWMSVRQAKYFLKLQIEKECVWTYAKQEGS